MSLSSLLALLSQNLFDQCCLEAFAYVVLVLELLDLDHVPCQGTLIALLRYGSFPSGRLSLEKWDVVDNDSEIMVFLEPTDDVPKMARKISRLLEADGWPPCTLQTGTKLVCFSLHLEVPMKVELYFFRKDLQQGIITGDMGNHFPLQAWGGRLPLEIIYPFSSCRLGSSWRTVACPNRPLEMLRLWNQSPGETEIFWVLQPNAFPEYVRAGFGQCLALPVISGDRDSGDARNQRFMTLGLVGEDLRLLEGYARALWKGGYASLLEELDSEPCLRRKEAILQGDSHAGFPWPPEWEEHDAREALLEEFQRRFEVEELKDPWTFRTFKGKKDARSRSDYRWLARQDASVASALRESGILDEQQAFWGLLLPETEMQAIARLESCQRQALYTVRAQATKLHDEALPRLRERFQRLGYGDEMLGTDLAPVIVHVHLDRVGAFLEVDEFYRNQFETKTSCGALDPENRTRQNWENVLFGGAYNDAKAFERPKYGALSVMNDYRGVISARQYGDSYLDVRLRCTFAGTDSGGISSSRLAVLDKYAHVLSEYNDNELHGEGALRPSGGIMESSTGPGSRVHRPAMFDFDELDERLPPRPSQVRQASQPAKPSPPPAPAVGPPSLESLLSEDSEELPDAPAPAELVKFEHPKPGENGLQKSNEPRKFIPDSVPAVAKAPVRQPNFGPRAAQRLHVPITPPVRGSFLPEDEELFMWMAQKCYLRQDMFLLGDPGPHLRLSILRFAQQTGREVEYISITRDTTEADLKQRREIIDGQLVFHNAPSVEAALRGRLLILEGLQKAERNVLPLLNNLLENREMSLEDGSFLMAPGREAEIQQAAEGGRRLLPVSQRFLVVALGLPVPTYRGTPLDPPLRSRFACRFVRGDENLRLDEVPKGLQQLVKLWRSVGEGTGGKTSATPRLPHFPEFGLLSVQKLLQLFPSLSPATALHRAFPWSILQLSASQRTALQSALKQHGLELGTAKTDYSLRRVELLSEHCARLSMGDGPSEVVCCPCGAWPSRFEQTLASLAPSQRAALASMLQDHAAGIDLCLVGERGVGKTTLIRGFAEALGYRTFSVFCFKEMSARDLTLRRSTDDRGNTIWQPSPLIEAALNGGLAILDGIHRLPLGALAGALGTLLCDRAGTLPDGTKMVPEEQWNHWLQQGISEATLRRQKFRPLHHAFRVIATGEPPTEERNWLEDELLTLFHFTEVKPLPAAQQLKLVSQLCGLPSEHAVLNGLMAYGKALRTAAKSDVSLQPLVLSLRQLLQLGRRCQQRPAAEVVQAALSGYLHFLPPLSKQAVQRMMQQAMKGIVQVDLDHHDASAQQRAEERGERLKALEEPAIGLRFMANPQAAQLIQTETAALKEEDAATRRRAREAVRRQAAEALAGRGSRGRQGMEVMEEEVRIGDVSCRRGKPERPELVPSTLFVDIPQHLAALRAMMIDWQLDRHLLLIGNQGVGKNKLADRFLGMLHLEREYLQLHRDTTVQSLTIQPMLQNGVVIYQDSPLVSAVRHGRVLVIDEADKAPLEVVCILKSLAEDGEFALGDGRTIMKRERLPKDLSDGEDLQDPKLLLISEGFRMIVLANRPGYPFLGNDFYRECGDVFASHAIDNPEVASEVELLRSYGPNVPQEQLVALLGLFVELRRLVEEQQLGFGHLESFPDDPVEEVFADIFAFDWHDRKLREQLGQVLLGCGFQGFEGFKGKGKQHGDAKRRLPKDFKSAKHYDSGENAENDGEGGNPGDVGTRDYDDATDHSGKRHAPRAGNWDGRQHIGEGPWDGGSGGTGTAGIGGRAGPYRLDVGQELVMLTEEQKKEVSEEWHQKAQQMADEAYAHRLNELKMSAHDEQEYAALRGAVEAQIAAFQLVLQSHEAKERERTWQKQQVQGELDEMRLVDGIAGAKNIYRRRGDAEDVGGDQRLRKRIKFVMDCSGSMYTFNRIDQRLQRLMEASIFIFESFAGFEHKYEYSMVGHSGTGPEAELLVPWGKPPRNPKEQLAIVKQMAAHAQYSHSGDHTLQATDRAIKDVLQKPGDEYYVFVVSDADLGRYGISPSSWNKILMQDRRVNAYVILISSNTDEAETIKSGLTPGHGFVCDHNDLLAVTFKQVFSVTMLRNRT
eukprot:s938_g9.t2